MAPCRSRRSTAWLVLAVLAFVTIMPWAVDAVYFMVQEGKPRCFYEDLSEDTLVSITYESPELKSRPKFLHPLGILITVRDPVNREIFRTIGEKGMDAVSFISSKEYAGEHKICFATNTSHWIRPNEMIMLSVEVDTGTDATNYEAIMSKEHLTKVEADVRRLNDKVLQIKKEQSYYKSRESRFRQTSESTNTRTMWLGVLQCVILVSLGLWQITSLKSFFKRKKLV